MSDEEEEYSAHAFMKCKPSSPMSNDMLPPAQCPHLVLPSSSPSFSLTLSPGHTSNDAIVVDNEPLWPADFYVVDVVDGFKDCECA